MDILKYKDYEGSAELDMGRGVCRGKILFIDDVVTYEALTPAELKIEFEAAVDDYLETCVQLGRAAKKSLKGQFNVRISPALHKAATLRGIADDICLNDVVVKALEAYTCARTEINHNVRVTVDMDEDSMKKIVSSASMPSQWGSLNVH